MADTDSQKTTDTADAYRLPSVLMRWLKTQPRLCVTGGVSAVFAGALTYLSLRLLQQAITAWPAIDAQVWTLLSGAVLARALCNLTSGYAFGRLAARALTEYRQWLFRKLIRAPVLIHDQAWSANLVSTLMGDAAFIQDALGRVLPTLVMHLPAVVVVTVLLYLTNSTLLLGLLLIGGPAMIVVLLIGRRMRETTRRSQLVLGKTAQAAQESLAGVRTIKLLARESLFITRFSALTTQHFDLKSRIAFWQALLSSTAPVVLLLIALAAAWIAQHQLADRVTTPAELSIFAALLLIMGSSILALLNAYAGFEPAFGAYQRMRRVNELALTAEPDYGAHIAASHGGLCLKNVSFEYPDRRAGVYDISMNIAPGETIALIGQNGAGKSTLIQLLLRLYTPSAGEILLDGNPAERISIPAWRRQFAVVTRDPVIFDLTIGENIALGKPDATQSDIERAAHAVQLDTFIASLPDGYHSRTGENGVRLSAGQRQRLALARVFLQNPAIIIFDEATTSLDRESEQALSLAMRAWQGKRTLLFVSHQPHDMWPASRTLSLVNGRITHERN
jgi:ATP-binding cassette, subfamily B, bacterial